MIIATKQWINQIYAWMAAWLIFTQISTEILHGQITNSNKLRQNIASAAMRMNLNPCQEYFMLGTITLQS